MQGEQKLSIQFLSVMINTAIHSRDYALTKLSYLSADNPRLMAERDEYILQRDNASRRIFEIQACINWLKTIDEPITV
jgi:hypothetical protein